MGQAAPWLEFIEECTVAMFCFDSLFFLWCTVFEFLSICAPHLYFLYIYTSTIQHRSGAPHENCDALSRRPCGDDEKEEPIHPCCRRTKLAHDRAANRETADHNADEFLNFTPESIAEAQQTDVDLKPILDVVNVQRGGTFSRLQKKPEHSGHSTSC